MANGVNEITWMVGGAAGYQQTVQVAAGKTYGDLFRALMPDKRLADYNATLLGDRNRLEQDYVVKDGDMISLKPLKIEGAIR